jgi:CheY-like chemotaxis protein
MTHTAAGLGSVGALDTSAPNVLLIEDDHSIGRLVRSYLERNGYRTVWVRSGEDGLIELNRHAIKIVVLDIGLPGIDGFEVAQRVRAIPSCRNVTLVALTGYGRSEDKERTRAAGFDHHLTKPVEIDALQGLVATLAKAGISPAGTPTLQ